MLGDLPRVAMLRAACMFPHARIEFLLLPWSIPSSMVPRPGDTGWSLVGRLIIILGLTVLVDILVA